METIQNVELKGKQLCLVSKLQMLTKISER